MINIHIPKPKQDYKILFPREYQLDGKKCIVKNMEELERFKKYIVGKRPQLVRNKDASLVKDRTGDLKYKYF